jgi:hypothetical protein
MAKFRKRIKIAPGVNLNLSKSGVSGTFGVKGASVNVGKNGAFLNTGIPGTGIYDRQKIGGGGGGADEAGALAEYENGEAGEPAEDTRFTTPEGIAKQKIRRAVLGWLSLAFLGFSIFLFVTGHWIWGIIFSITFIMFLGTYAGLKKDIEKAEAGQSAEPPAAEEK